MVVSRRRDVLGYMASAASGLLLSGQGAAAKDVVLPFANGVRSTVPAGLFPQKSEMILQRTRPPLLETPWSVLGQQVFTPNDSFFVRWHLADFPTHVDVDAYRIKVFGQVERPYEIGLRELMSGFHPIDLAAINQCSGNSRGRVSPRVPGAQWLDGAMGNAMWTGVPLEQLVARAKPLPGATHIGFRTMERLVSMFPQGDLYEKYLPIEKALDGKVMLAYGMNGSEMPLLNGAPVRLIVPGWYSTYWVKMVSEIEVTNHPGPNYWMAGAYKVPDTPNGSMNPGQTGLNFVPISAMTPRSFFSNIDSGARLPINRPFAIRGLAMGGDADLTAVDLSGDGGHSWKPAALGKDWGAYSFREWTCSWSAETPGPLRLLARASNSKGEQQPLVAGWNPGGFMYNGVARVDVQAA